MNGLPLLLVHGTQVGPFVQQQLHHLGSTETPQRRRFKQRRWGGGVEEPNKQTHLLEPALGRVVQGGSAGAVRHVQVAQMGQQRLGAAGGAVGGRHVQRRLPELVPCVRLRPAPQQQTYDPLWVGGGGAIKKVSGPN